MKKAAYARRFRTDDTVNSVSDAGGETQTEKNARAADVPMQYTSAATAAVGFGRLRSSPKTQKIVVPVHIFAGGFPCVRVRLCTTAEKTVVSDVFYSFTLRSFRSNGIRTEYITKSKKMLEVGYG